MNKVKTFFTVLFLSIALIVIPPSKPAYAQCEGAMEAVTALLQMVQGVIDLIDGFLSDALQFITSILNNVLFEMVERFMEFSKNIRDAIGGEFWGQYLPAMKLQTQQLNVADVDQSRVMGSFLDAQSQTETQRDMKVREQEAHRRFRISAFSCQAESIKDTLTETEELTENIAKALGVAELNRQSSRVGSISEGGQESEHNFLYNEANTNFCALGQVGCAAPGPNPMGNILNANFTNGVNMSHDMSNPQNRILMDRVLTTFTSPISASPMPMTAIDMTVVQREIVYERNPLMARKSLLNYVMGEQLGAAVSGNDNMQVSAARTGSNVNPARTSLNPSKREIIETMREKILSDAFVRDTLTDPEDLLRRQATMKEQQLRIWLQIKDRNEERLALLASLLGQELSTSQPQASVGSRIKR